VSATRDHGWIRSGEGRERWQIPDPESDALHDAMHTARYNLKSLTQEEAYRLCEVASAYVYLLAECPTTTMAIEKVRTIRAAVKAPPDGARGSGT